MSKIILIKMTSRERPELLVKTLKTYYDMASNKNDLLFLVSLDTDDISCNNEKTVFNIISVLGGLSNSHNITIIFGTSTDKINAINRDINQYPQRWDILVNCSDDQLPMINGYDDIIRNLMPDTLDYSLWFNDGHQNRLNTMEIIGYNYYMIDKHIYNPIYKSFFSDNHAMQLAFKRNKLIKSDECIIKHFHPLWDTQQTHTTLDDLYRRNDKYWKQDQDTYTLQEKNNFE